MMKNILMIGLLACGTAWASATTTQPVGTISLYHAIITADDDGLMVQGLAEMVSHRNDTPVVLRFDLAVDLQAQATPENVTIKTHGDTLEVYPPSTDDSVKVEFQYFRPWPDDVKTPLKLRLPSLLPIETVMISLPILGLKFETFGLKKTHLQSQDVYTAFDLSAENDVAVLIYPPEPWAGHSAGRYVIWVSALIVLVCVILKAGWFRHA